MAVRFILGRSGSGKTRHCVREIAAACAADPFGPPLVYLVPEQASYQSERALLDTGLADGYCRAQVLSFTRLADYVFAQSPAPSRPHLTANHRALAATLLVAAERHSADNPLIHAPGIEDALADFIAETKQYGIGQRELSAAIAVAGVPTEGGVRAPGLLEGKLRLLAAMLAKYEVIIRERFVDPQETLLGLCTLIQRGTEFQGAEVYVDGFVGFTPVEEKLLLALASKARRLSIVATCDGGRAGTIIGGGAIGRHPVFRPAEETIQRLCTLFAANGIAIAPSVEMEDGPAPRFAEPFLAALERGFLSRNAAPTAVGESLRLVEAETPREEARLAAETAAQWIREHGWSPADIGVIARDLEGYAPALEEAFRILRLPHFIDRSLPLETHPLVVGIRALVRAALHPERTEFLLQLGKSGFVALSRPALDRLEIHLLQYPRSAREWYSTRPWEAKPARSPFEDADPTEEDSVIDGEADAVRRLLAETARSFRDAFAAKDGEMGLLRDFLSALCAAISKAHRGMGVPPVHDTAPASRTLAVHGQDAHATVEEDDRILARIGELFGELDDLCGGEVVAWRLAGEMVLRTLNQLALPRIPPLLDQVFVGQADRSRQPPLKGVILLGMNEGSFPRPTVNRSLLNDAEREYLESVGLELRPSSRRLFERESFLAYRAVSSASHRVALLRARTDGAGGATTPSPYWQNIRALANDHAVEAPPAFDSPTRAWRPRELAVAALRGFGGAHVGPRPLSATVQSILLPLTDPIGQMEVARVLSAAAWRNRPSLDPARIASLLGNKIGASASYLECRARCPYQHFVRYFLRPNEIESSEFQSTDAGNFAHATLSRFTALMRDRGLDTAPLDEAALDSLFAEAVGPPRKRLVATGMAAHPSGKVLLDRLEKILRGMAVWIREAIRLMQYQPVREEAKFGGRAADSLAGLALGEFAPGWSLELRGQIDRIDIGASDGSRQAIAVDYKLRQRKFDFSLWEAGENLQLPVYMLVIAANPELDAAPAGGLYAEILPAKDADGLEKPRKFLGVYRDGAVQGDLANVQTVLQHANGAPEKDPPPKWGSAITDREFNALLLLSRQTIAEIASAVVSGDISVAPSRRGNATACTYCQYGPVCGIDYTLNRARTKPMRSRPDI